VGYRRRETGAFDAASRGGIVDALGARGAAPRRRMLNPFTTEISMKSNARPKKLSLKKETLRNLQNAELSQIAGGMPTTTGTSTVITTTLTETLTGTITKR
jgi:hypothetical protein